MLRPQTSNILEVHKRVGDWLDATRSGLKVTVALSTCITAFNRIVTCASNQMTLHHMHVHATCFVWYIVSVPQELSCTSLAHHELERV